MEVRIGKCTSCEAEFQVPVAFDQPWAKCLICEGPVRIGEPQAAPKPRGRAAAPAAVAAAAAGSPAPAGSSAPTADPSPAAVKPPLKPKAKPKPKPKPRVEPKPAPKPEPEAELEEAELELEPLEEAPTPAKGGTLERLKAQRQSEASSGPGKALEGSTLERLKAQRHAQDQQLESAKDSGSSTLDRLKAARREDAAAAVPARPAQPSAPAERGRGADDDAPSRAEAKRGRGSSRRPAAGGKRRRAAAAGREKNPAVLWGGIGTLALIAVGAYGISAGWFSGSGDADASTAPEEVAAAEPTAPEPATPTIDPFASVAVGQGLPTPAVESTDTTPEAGTAAPVEPAAPPQKNPADVDLAALPDLEPLPETGAEDWSAYQADAARLTEERGGIGTQRAQGRLAEVGRPAIPAVINAFKGMDLSTDAGQRAGALVQRTLEEMTNGLNFGWRDGSGPDGEYGPNEEYFNKRVVEEWHKLWLRKGLDQAVWNAYVGLEEQAPEPPGDEELIDPEDIDDLIGEDG